jgi:hypothetical protein
MMCHRRSGCFSIVVPQKIMRSRQSSFTHRMKRSMCGDKYGDRGGKRTASTPPRFTVTLSLPETRYWLKLLPLRLGAVTVVSHV